MRSLLNPIFDSVTTDSVNIAGITPDYVVADTFQVDETSDQSTTSTNYGGGLGMMGTAAIDDLPSEYTLYGRFITGLTNDTGGETTRARPRLFDLADDSFIAMDSLEISATGTSTERVDSGWVEITESLTGPVRCTTINFEVSGGTGTIEYDWVLLSFAGVAA